MSPIRLGSAVSALFAVVILLAGCGGRSTAPQTEDQLESIPSQVAVASPAQSLSPSFSVSTGAGTRFSSDKHGGEVLVLYFSFPG